MQQNFSRKKPLDYANWIWCDTTQKEDEYGEFTDCFTYESGNAVLYISADSNYAAYINGELAAWGQYADFPYDKVYDEVDVTSLCQKGKNHLAILVWYYGLEDTSTYYPGNAGLIYTLANNENLLCKSDTNTLSRKSNSYLNHRMHIISSEIGLGYGYDATREDNWLKNAVDGFHPSAIVEQSLPLRPRPCKRLTLLPPVKAVPCKRLSDTDIVFDLKSEQVGFLSFSLTSPCEQNITIAYGEHIVDGAVRRFIGPRDFSAFYRAKKGINNFFNPFRRFGGRYLEIHSQYPLVIEHISIVPTVYMVKEKERPVLNETHNKIYDMCLETLRLCMHEHYEDCPWREQALYAMDSRNQILCGYYAFGEYQFPRANLQLIAKDNRPDGLLSICYPMKMDLVIPSFSLHYITECREYLEHSKDSDFLLEIYPKLVSIIHAFTIRIKDGLIPLFEGENYWNFYEWSEYLDGNLGYADSAADYDLVLNALLSISLQNMAFIADELNLEQNYNEIAEQLNHHIRLIFCNAETGIYYNRPDHLTYSQLGNALAILCGAATNEEAHVLCERMLIDEEMTPITLSMQCFKYDAWIKIDKQRYAPIILEQIENNYKPMIDFGSTTVWETINGESDFENAGSLCHGWSALPIYYYHILSE